MDPRWVWKRPPGVNASRCWRPFGSVSWTRSPGRNGPRRAAPAGTLIGRCLAASAGDPDRPRHVLGGEDTVDRAGALHDDVLRRGGPLQRLDERGPGEIGVEDQAGLEAAGECAHADPRAAVVGRGDDG